MNDPTNLDDAETVLDRSVTDMELPDLSRRAPPASGIVDDGQETELDRPVVDHPIPPPVDTRRGPERRPPVEAPGSGRRAPIAETPKPGAPAKRPAPGRVPARRPVRTASDPKRDTLVYVVVGVVALLVLLSGVALAILVTR
ncbi:MAG TPA: hypothetical protein RMH99_15060 [Sandaracinaceae bacterium LLY-WYZ-13_1]|nr:hypothetical protein [Sandaracinaceae bacterium LLY-WYZ-13_1]